MENPGVSDIPSLKCIVSIDAIYLHYYGIASIIYRYPVRCFLGTKFDVLPRKWWFPKAISSSRGPFSGSMLPIASMYGIIIYIYPKKSTTVNVCIPIPYPWICHGLVSGVFSLTLPVSKVWSMPRVFSSDRCYGVSQGALGNDGGAWFESSEGALRILGMSSFGYQVATCFEAFFGVRILRGEREFSRLPYWGTNLYILKRQV